MPRFHGEASSEQPRASLKDETMKRKSGAIFAVVAACGAHAALAADEPSPWWRVQDQAGLADALKEYGITIQAMNKDAEAFERRSQNKSDPLYWLRRSVDIYGNAHSGEYRIPITETHGNAKRRMTSFGRTGYFPTDRFVSPGNEISVRLARPLPVGVACTVSTATDMNQENHIFEPVALRYGADTVYKPARAGTLMFECREASENMVHVGEKAVIHIASGGQSVPMFVFGVTPSAQWKSMAIQPNPLGQVILFGGRTRFYVPATKARNAAGMDIAGFMRQHLAVTMSNDRANGFDDQSGPLHEPTQSLINASYAACCNAVGTLGQIRIGFSGSPKSNTGWGDWHEYGHQYQLGWSWKALVETSVNINSLVSCKAIKGNVPLKECGANKSVAEMTWSTRAVPDFIASGQRYNFDQMGAGTEFVRLKMFAQLLFSYEHLYADLGWAYREAYNRGQGSAQFNTDVKKKDWFVVNASRFSGHDLRVFFDHWGLKYSAQADAAVARLGLPAP
jgi:hypothetical protein